MMDNVSGSLGLSQDVAREKLSERGWGAKEKEESACQVTGDPLSPRIGGMFEGKRRTVR